MKNKMNSMRSDNDRLGDVINDIMKKYAGKHEEKTIAKMFLVNNEHEAVELEALKTLSFLDFKFDIDSYSDVNKLGLTKEEKKEIILNVLPLNIFELKMLPENPSEFCADEFLKEGLGKGEYKVFVIAEDVEECKPSVYDIYLNSKDAPYNALFIGKC